MPSKVIRRRGTICEGGKDLLDGERACLLAVFRYVNVHVDWLE